MKNAGPFRSNGRPQLSWDVSGGPGTRAPGQITYSTCPLKVLIREAYGLPFDQIRIPGTLDEERYTIIAKAPDGSTRSDIALMLQNLLAERLRLTIHWEPRSFAVYELQIAKNGSKLRVAAEPEAPPMRPGVGWQPDRDGFPVLSGVRGKAAASKDGVYYLTCHGCSVRELLNTLQTELGSNTGPHTWAPARIADKTGLAGVYDFHLQYASSGGTGGSLSAPDTSLETGGITVASEPLGPTLFSALEKQLGLRLTRTSSVLKMLVVDHAERVPVGN